LERRLSSCREGFNMLISGNVSVFIHICTQSSTGRAMAFHTYDMPVQGSRHKEECF
jgi:hypothetical protein